MPRTTKRAVKPPSDSGEDDHDEHDLSDVEEPPTIDPYEVLGLERDATADQIKTAYRKAALKNHPGMTFPSLFSCSQFLFPFFLLLALSLLFVFMALLPLLQSLPPSRSSYRVLD